MRAKIRLEHQPTKTGEKVTIHYQGLLADQTAEQIYLHLGKGQQEDWQEIKEVKMQLSPDGTWTADLEVSAAQTLNFCFRDAAGNWDNNNGQDWSYYVEE